MWFPEAAFGQRREDSNRLTSLEVGFPLNTGFPHNLLLLSYGWHILRGFISRVELKSVTVVCVNFGTERLLGLIFQK